MAFSMAGSVQGPALSEIQTEGLGFLSLAGEAKLRLSTAWSPPPAAHSSLLAIAAKRSLVAAAGPDAVILASTATVRKAFESPKDGDSEVRAFTPEAKLPLPFRICQLAFSADESHLILSAEQNGGLAVYDVNSLQRGSTQSVFQTATNGESLRALVPNPRPEKADLCAVVTTEGKLLMADLKKRDFILGTSGPILRDGVSCVAWSNKGKQIVAGLGDGTMLQMTPEGDVKAEIARPPQLDANFFASTVVWLENDLFLVFHVCTTDRPQTKCHLITRKDKNFQYQPLNDPVDPFGSNKIPHHTAARLKDFPPNLQDLLIFSSTAVPDIGLLARSAAPFAPNGPTGVFVNVELADDSRRATLPMGEDLETPAPIGSSLDLSSRDNVYKPIPSDEIDQSPGPLPGYWVLNDQGVLSIWWIVYSESIRSQTVYPGLAAADILSSNVKPAPAQTTQAGSFGSASATRASPFGSASNATSVPAFGGPSAIGPQSSPWGGTSAPTGSGGGSRFGSATFGSSGTPPSQPVFGQSSFGSNTKPAFGQSSGLGVKASPWTSGPTSSITATFGQSGFTDRAANPGVLNGTSSNTPSNPFASGASGGDFASLTPKGTDNKPSNPFAAAINAGGFASLSSEANGDKPNNPFASGSTGGGFASFASKGREDKPSIFASPSSTFPATDAKSSFPASDSQPSTGSPFGSQPFKLTSSFKPASDTETSSNSKTSTAPEKSMFGSGFASSVPEESTKTATSNIFGGKRQGLFSPPEPTSNVESTTPTATPAANKFFTAVSTTSSETKTPFSFPSSSSKDLFGQPASKLNESSNVPEDLPLPPDTTNSNQSRAEDAPLPSHLPLPAASDDRTSTRDPPFAASDAPLPPDPSKNKTAYSAPLPPLPSVTAKPRDRDAGDAPLPPDPIKNKKAYESKLPPLPGDSQAKATSEVPLPPDPVKQPGFYEKKTPALPVSVVSSAAAGPGFKFPTDLPPVSDSGDDEDGDGDSVDEDKDVVSEGSGVDVAKDLSPSSTTANRTPGYTPQSSFDGLAGSCSTISRPDPDRRNLFGELGRNVPVLSQPNPVSPRSPSPVRGAVPPGIFGGEHSRSFSAPGMASQLLGRKPSQARLGASIVGRGVALEKSAIEQQRKAKAKKEAEEAQALVDEEDEAVQNLLKTQIPPSLELDEFIAHSGVVAPAGDSVPAQVEAVYRDVNSMIDTLGLNARSLKAFTMGHNQSESGRLTRQDLVSPDAWVLSDIRHLTFLVDQDLGEVLDEARITNGEEILSEVQELMRELARDYNKQADLRKTIAARLDPEKPYMYQSLPLSGEQAAQQSDLRRQLGQFQMLLAQAEENLALLKAKIVSATGGSGRGGPVPTIEAIVRTITKMTSMVEKRSGDIDVLENQMRKLRFGSAGPAGSREGSPFATPNAKRGMGSSMFSPERSTREGSTPARNNAMRHSLSRSMSMMSIGDSSFRTPPRKKLSGFGDVERKAVKAKREQRGAILEKLKGSIQQKNPGVWALDDIE